MKLRDLLNKFCTTKDGKVVIRFGVSLDEYRVKIHDSITFAFGKTIPNEILDKEVIDFLLGGELYPNTLFITVEEIV